VLLLAWVGGGAAAVGAGFVATVGGEPAHADGWTARCTTGTSFGDLYHQHSLAHEREQKLEGRYLPNVEHLLVVTQESPSPDEALTVQTGVSWADPFYLLLDITDSSNRRNRNLKRMRISG
jgi:hypothetical protein